MHGPAYPATEGAAVDAFEMSSPMQAPREPSILTANTSRATTLGAIKIAHIVNPLVVDNRVSDLTYAQPVTIESMRRARSATRTAQVVHYAAYYQSDLAAVPPEFVLTPPLEQSILDFVSAPEPASARKLPLLRDILDRLYTAATDADYMVYSNIDIGLWPDFYDEIVRLVDQGIDSFTIGRRTLGTEFTSVADMEHILNQEGTPHHGLSCFVFPRSHYPRFILGKTCIGLQPVGVTITVNLMQQAANFKNLLNERLTFHLGDDRIWHKTLLDPYHLYNERQLDETVSHFKPDGLTADAEDLLRRYSRWRSDYVIQKCTSRLRKFLYRVVRKLGFVRWVASRYTGSHNRLETQRKRLPAYPS
jgi:hypothetical protein